MSFHSYLWDCKVENAPDSNPSTCSREHTAFLPGDYGATLGFMTLQQKLKIALEKVAFVTKVAVETGASQINAAPPIFGNCFSYSVFLALESKKKKTNLIYILLQF